MTKQTQRLFKKPLLMIVALLMTVLVGCSPEQESKDTSATVSTEEVVEKQVEKATVRVTDNEKNLLKEVPVVIGEDDITLMNIMENEFDLEKEGEFITSIEGVSQDAEEGLWWVFTANDEMVEVGAADYVLQPGDEIDWTLTKF